MKNLSWFDKILFLLNSLFAAALLFSYLLPYIPPKTFALLSVLSLAVPMFIIINGLFLLYWMIRVKKQLLLPLVILLLGFNHLTSMFVYSASDKKENSGDYFSVVSYNVKQFNQYKWSEQLDIPERISQYLKEESPDVVGLQEYYTGALDIAQNFPHKFIHLKEDSSEFGLAILSKYRIINTGSMDFPTKSNNNGIFADIVRDQDTIRFITVHLQSFGIKPELDKMEKEHSKRVFKGMGQTFVRQQDQLEIVLEVIRESPHRVVLAGDFNNTPYSFIYRKIRSHGMVDAFKEKGNGFGRTFDFDYFPLRIDYIMAEESIRAIDFEVSELPYSDHFPVKATLEL